MLNLMKYEARRQLLSKGLILGVLVTLLVGFTVCYCRGIDQGAAMFLSLMALATIMVLFFAPFEFTFTFDKDMNTKQGYLLFLVPQKSTTILGAKLLVSLLQSAVIYTLFLNVVPFCERLCANKFGSAPGFIGEIIADVSYGLSGTMDVIKFWALLLLLWLFFAVLALLVSAIPVQGKVVSVFKFVGYIAAIFVVFYLLGMISGLFSYLSVPEPVADIFEWIYMIGIDVALFFGTAKLLDKKVSI